MVLYELNCVSVQKRVVNLHLGVANASVNVPRAIGDNVKYLRPIVVEAAGSAEYALCDHAPVAQISGEQKIWKFFAEVTRGPGGVPD